MFGGMVGGPTWLVLSPGCAWPLGSVGIAVCAPGSDIYGCMAFARCLEVLVFSFFEGSHGWVAICIYCVPRCVLFFEMAPLEESSECVGFNGASIVSDEAMCKRG